MKCSPSMCLFDVSHVDCFNFRLSAYLPSPASGSNLPELDRESYNLPNCPSTIPEQSETPEPPDSPIHIKNKTLQDKSNKDNNKTVKESTNKSDFNKTQGRTGPDTVKQRKKSQKSSTQKEHNNNPSGLTIQDSTNKNDLNKPADQTLQDCTNKNQPSTFTEAQAKDCSNQNDFSCKAMPEFLNKNESVISSDSSGSQLSVVNHPNGATGGRKVSPSSLLLEDKYSITNEMSV